MQNFDPQTIADDIAQLKNDVENLRSCVSEVLSMFAQLGPIIPALLKEHSSDVAGAGVATAAPLDGTQVGDYSGGSGEPGA